MDICTIVAEIAAQMELCGLSVSLSAGEQYGCLNVYLLSISARGQMANMLVYPKDIDDAETGIVGDRFEARIKGALSQLKLMIQ